MAKNKKNDVKNQDFFEGLTFAEFKKINRTPIAMSDIAWSGRLFSSSQFWNSFFTKGIFYFSLVSVVCLAIIWVSLFLRPPALLLGVYPDGQMVCFPNLIDRKGQKVALDPAYFDLCSSLNKKGGARFSTEKPSSPIEKGEPPVYVLIDDVFSARPAPPQPF